MLIVTGGEYWTPIRGQHSAPIDTEAYRPRSVILLQERLTADILAHIDASGLSAVEITNKIAAVYPTFRLGYIASMRNGILFGVNRLLSICEALGILIVFSTARTQRHQIDRMEAA